MNQDSPSTQAPSRANGTANPSAFASDAPRSLEEVAVDLRRRVLHLLQLQTEDQLLQKLQQQVRLSLGVIEESFRRYRYVYISSSSEISMSPERVQF